MQPLGLEVPDVDAVVQTAADQELGGGAQAHARLPFLEDVIRSVDRQETNDGLRCSHPFGELHHRDWGGLEAGHHQFVPAAAGAHQVLV